MKNEKSIPEEDNLNILKNLDDNEVEIDENDPEEIARR